MAKKRAKAMTRDTMISMLRTRGAKGRLSKMTKPQLKALVEKTAPPDDRSAHMTLDNMRERLKNHIEHSAERLGSTVDALANSLTTQMQEVLADLLRPGSGQ